MDSGVEGTEVGVLLSLVCFSEKHMAILTEEGIFTTVETHGRSYSASTHSSTGFVWYFGYVRKYGVVTSYSRLLRISQRILAANNQHILQ